VYYGIDWPGLLDALLKSDTIYRVFVEDESPLFGSIWMSVGRSRVISFRLPVRQPSAWSLEDAILTYIITSVH
jgi:hypothetical protein